MGQEATRLDDDRGRLNTTPAGEPTITSDDPEVIENEIEHTRAEMSETIDEIQERLNPQVLKAQAKQVAYDKTIGRVVDAKDQAVEKVQGLVGQATDKVHDAGGGDGDRAMTSTVRDTGGTIVETIRANPIPAAIAGAGLGWFITRRSDSHHEVRSGYMRNAQSNQRGYRGRQMDYRTGYTNWDRRQPDPGHLREYEEDSMMHQVTSTGGDVVDMIQRNPIPAALAGVGLGWFLMRRARDGDHGEQPYYYRPSRHTTFSGNYGGYDYRGGQGYDTQGYGYQSYGTQGNWQQGQEQQSGRMGEMAGQMQGRAGDTMHRAQDMGGDAMHRAQDMGSQARDQISHFGDMARDQIGDLPHQAQDQFRNLRGTYDQKMQDNPLIMGVVAMGLGLAVGLLLPETKKEDQFFGEKRDELMHQAQDMAGEAVHRAQDVAQEAVQAAQETAMESGKEAAKDVAQHHGQSQSQSSASTS